MVKFLKQGKVVIVTNGRFAGRKAVILKSYDSGEGKRQYGHALVAGVDRYPLPVTRSMSKRKVSRRSRVKPFLKVVNYNHILPTRYAFDADLSKVELSKDPVARRKAKGVVKRTFQEKYNSGKNKWFFSKLRF